jgi:hypothetical protein
MYTKKICIPRGLCLSDLFFGIEGLFFAPKLSVGQLWLLEVVGLIPTDEERTKSAEGKRLLGYVHVYD